MSGWYVKRDDKKYGPYSSAQLVEMAKKGQVLPVDCVAQGEGEKWMPASQVKGLFAASAVVVPPPLPAAIVPPLPASVPVKASVELLRVIPARIAPPVIGMSAVVLLALLASFFSGSLLVFCLSSLHIGGAVACIVLATRLQRFLYAPLAALLTLTVWGWYCFSGVPTIISILGLLVGIAVGGWALWMFRSPEVKALFADAGKPGPLDRLGTPVLAGIAGGLLVVILGIGGVWHMVSGGKSGTTTAGKNDSSGGSRKSLSATARENSEYKRGYKIGSDLGKRSVNGRQLDDPRIRPSAMKEFNKQKRNFEKSYQDLLRSYGPDHDGTLLYRGMLDGYTEEIAKAGIDLD